MTRSGNIDVLPCSAIGIGKFIRRDPDYRSIFRVELLQAVVHLALMY